MHGIAPFRPKYRCIVFWPITCYTIVQTLRFRNSHTRTCLSVLVDCNRKAGAFCIADTEGVTEALKADDPMAWVRKMNGIRHRANEVVMQEIVYG